MQAACNSLLLYLAVRREGAEAERAVVPVLEASTRLARDRRRPLFILPPTACAAVASQPLGSDRVHEHRVRRCCDVRDSANLENAIRLQVEKRWKGALTALCLVALFIYLKKKKIFYVSTTGFLLLMYLV